MCIRTGSIRFRAFTLFQTHKCKVIFIIWLLRQRRMTITVWSVPAKMAILRRSFNFMSLHQVDPEHSRGPIRSQEPWFGRSSSQPSLPHLIFMCTREHWLIYWRTNNVYIAWLLVWIHFELDWNHAPPEVDWKQAGLNLVWTDPLLVWTRQIRIEPDWMRIECAVWTGLTVPSKLV